MALKEIEPGISISFLGSGRPLEQSIFSKAGNFSIHAVPMNGIKDLGMSGLIRFLLKLPRAICQTWTLLTQVKPDCIVGVGGYVTVLPIILGRLRGIPGWIHEAELKPGLANYLLSFFAEKISVAYQNTKMPTTSNVIVTGHPVRPGLETVAASASRITPPKNIIVLGGSQGASALDEVMPTLGDFFNRHGMSVRHQCRKGSKAQLEKEYTAAGVQAEVFEFIDDMHEAYCWADIIISRSGAGSIMELGIVNKPSVLVPFRFSQGGHQVANARLLSDLGKAILCEEGDEFAVRLREALTQVADLGTYNRMLRAPNPTRNTDAAKQIAQGVLSLKK